MYESVRRDEIGESTRLQAKDIVAHDDEAEKEEDQDDDETRQVLYGSDERLLQPHQLPLQAEVLERLDHEDEHGG